MTLFELGQRYAEARIQEQPNSQEHPLIQWWLSLCRMGLHAPDETPWCSAFVNGLCWELRLPRSRSASARSWLTVGQAVLLSQAAIGDVVVLQRGHGSQPDASVLHAPGHVGLYAGRERRGAYDVVHVLGGNQGDTISVEPFDVKRVLGVRRLV
jgi:uncharacterized protein (TIGR02594 family)